MGPSLGQNVLTYKSPLQKRKGPSGTDCVTYRKNDRQTDGQT